LRQLWLGLSGLTLMCARPGPMSLAHAEATKNGPMLPLAAPTQKPPPAPGPSASSLPASAVAPDRATCAAGPLSTFFGALGELEQGARSSHLRVLWLGDSHTNADFLSGSVRGILRDRFGDGGPGFVRIGTKPYRHEGVKTGRAGPWNVDPDPPARRTPQAEDAVVLWRAAQASARRSARRAAPKPNRRASS